MDKKRIDLKEYFETGDRPTQVQFEELIDAVINKEDDKVYVGLVSQVGVPLPEPQVSLGTTPPGIVPGPETELVRLNVDKRLSTNKLQVRSGASDKHLLFSDTHGNGNWGPQSNVDDDDWKVKDKQQADSDMYAHRLGGYVGIGTDTPTEKLTLWGMPKNNSKNLGLHVFNAKTDVGSKASLSLQVNSTPSRWELTSEKQQWNNESALKLRRYASGNPAAAPVNYLWINDNTNSIHMNTLPENNVGTPGEYVLWNGNVGLNKMPAVRLDVGGDTNVDGNVRTNTLNIDNAGAGANTDLVLTIDGGGNVRKFPANQLITEAHGLWTDDGYWNLHGKDDRGIVVKKGAYINHQLIVNGGIIRKGGPDALPNYPHSDLGLYSFNESNWNRYVTNRGSHKFYVDLNGASGQWPQGVLEVNPGNANGDFKVQQNHVSVNGNLLVNGEFPFAVRAYSLQRAGGDNNEDPTWYLNTGVPVDDYPGAAVIGFRATAWQTKEMAEGRDFQVFLSRKHNGSIYQWQIVANVPNRHEEFGSGYEENDWYVQVLFIRKGLIDMPSDLPGFGTI